MSIHPQYAHGILAGTKTVEFRKRRLADDVTHVVVYATAPVSAVVGAFEIEAQHTLDPTTLWETFQAVAGISRDGFFSYFAGRPHGTGIEVREAVAFDAPLSLLDDFEVKHPPQSFQYLAEHHARRTLAGMATASA
ncbi:hypothetical protein [Solicola sp. PLA-1-18]|uniref:hypothetical protein n=1 Tax=Solicola sp. PLA-1-18 TaxID=3380532 RepID=UPI003B82B42A